jgi:uncharacterized protein (TIGR00369 family)
MLTAGQDGHGLAAIRKLVTDPSRLAPIATLLGAKVLSVEAGRVTVEFAVKNDFMHRGQAVQGGIITAYVDLSMGLAANTLFDRGESYSTTQLSISFVLPVTEGPVVGEGFVVKKGRSTIFLEAILRDLHGREYARASSVGALRRLK